MSIGDLEFAERLIAYERKYSARRSSRRYWRFCTQKFDSRRIL